MSWKSWPRHVRVRLAQAKAAQPDLDDDAPPVDLLDPYAGSTFDGDVDANMRRRLAGMLDRFKR